MKCALTHEVPSHLCGMEGSAAVTQWVFIHLQRILQTHQVGAAIKPL